LSLRDKGEACWKLGRGGSVTSVKNGVATGSTKQSLRIPKKSEVRRT